MWASHLDGSHCALGQAPQEAQDSAALATQDVTSPSGLPAPVSPAGPPGRFLGLTPQQWIVTAVVAAIVYAIYQKRQKRA